jgi:hypothetical protein
MAGIFAFSIRINSAETIQNAEHNTRTNYYPYKKCWRYIGWPLNHDAESHQRAIQHNEQILKYAIDHPFDLLLWYGTDLMERVESAAVN